MVAKTKISKAKHNNQKKNKLVKKGVIKSKKVKKLKKQNEIKVAQPVVNNDVESEESDDGQDMLSMVEPDDLEFMKNAISSKSYSILNSVRAPQRKRKRNDADEADNLEEEYEINTKEPVKTRHLLPLKGKDGIIMRSTPIVETVQSDEEAAEEEVQEDEDEEEDANSDDEFISKETEEINVTKSMSTAELLAQRSRILQQKKIEIGVLSSSVLESPEEKIMNLNKLLKYFDDETPEIYLTVRKLVIIALLEVFKDILPSYSITHHIDTKEVKLKKDTLKLQKYEDYLLQFYKKYLQKLEKYTEMLFKKMGDTRVRTTEHVILGETSIHALCDLLVTHPYFNLSENIAQVVVPFLNNPNKNVRETVSAACKTVFKEDKKDEITLKIMRILNQYLKKHSHNVHPDMLDILLSLKIKEVNLDQEKEHEIKQKKLKSHKGNILQLSKREKKRNKKLQLLEQEMLETKAEENKQVKQKNITEITKILFGIYFRILKSSSNTKVLGVCLEGLAKYAHCINLEFYVDIVNVLDRLLKEDWIGYRERLFCIQTVFSILSGVGEALTLDPTRFYTNLYKDILTVNSGKNHEHFKILLDTLTKAIIKRRKKITNRRTIGFVKRVATLSLQLLHNGSLSCLSFVKTMVQLNFSVDILLDMDSDIGEGKYQPEVDDPEYCNAGSSALYELSLLTKHYHPIVSKYAKHIANGCPASGEGSLPSEFGKCTMEDLWEKYDMSTLGFNPPVPPPKKSTPKSRPKRLEFYNEEFKNYCYGVVNSCTDVSLRDLKIE